jgi:hypothetical protein
MVEAFLAKKRFPRALDSHDEYHFHQLKRNFTLPLLSSGSKAIR